jgi:hypothetical protein
MEISNMSNLVNTDSNSSASYFAGDFPRVIKPVTVVAGEGALVKGTVLGKLTAGNYAKYDNTANDGSETAKAILTEGIDATEEAVNTSAWFAGDFNEDALTGLDDAAKADFEGTPVFFGKVL